MIYVQEIQAKTQRLRDELAADNAALAAKGTGPAADHAGVAAEIRKIQTGGTPTPPPGFERVTYETYTAPGGDNKIPLRSLEGCGLILIYCITDPSQLLDGEFTSTVLHLAKNDSTFGGNFYDSRISGASEGGLAVLIRSAIEVNIINFSWDPINLKAGREYVIVQFYKGA